MIFFNHKIISQEFTQANEVGVFLSEPCPFCGSDDLTQGGNAYMRWIGCQGCGVRVFRKAENITRDNMGYSVDVIKLIEAWNNRRGY